MPDNLYGGHMKLINLDDLQRSVTFTNIYGLNQNWTKTTTWSCIGTPRPQHGFMYILCDRVHITSQTGEHREFQRDDLIYIPKSSEYFIEFFETKGDLSNVLINFDIFDSEGGEYYMSDDITLLASGLPAKITNAMISLAQLSTNLTNPTLQVTKIFYEIIEKLNNHILASKLHNAGKCSVLPAVYYLNSHITDDVPIPQLAQMCLLNESAFRKAFKEHTGFNPVQYKINLKIEKSKLLLDNAHEMPVEEIAECLGFYDNAYFHKVFSKIEGMTPKQYRDRKR